MASSPELRSSSRRARRRRAHLRSADHRTNRDRRILVAGAAANHGREPRPRCYTPARLIISPRMPAASPPRWARLVDFICLTLVALALVLWWFGGFRMRVAGMRLSITSPYRTLAWAVALGIARQLLAPAIPIYRDAPPRLLALLRSESARSAAVVLLATRLAVVAVGCFGLFAIGYREGGAPWKLIETNEFVNLQARWDTGWYLGIAIEGYTYDPNLSADKQQNIVFFPAFPLMMRVAGRLLGGSSPAFLLGGTLVALSAFF